MELYVSFVVEFGSVVVCLRTKNHKATGAKFTPRDLETGAVAIAEALWGKYKDVNGKLQTVNGDITKVSYVPGLSEAAHVLLKNIAHTSRK